MSDKGHDAEAPGVGLSSVADEDSHREPIVLMSLWGPGSPRTRCEPHMIGAELIKRRTVEGTVSEQKISPGSYEGEDIVVRWRLRP